MGAKLYADTSTKTLVVTLAPDVNGEVRVNAQIDVWSDLIEDWESTLALRKFTFPVRAIGGDTISAGKLGTTYVLLDPWQIAPYEADHELIIDGNLFTESALVRLILPTAGAYTVVGTRNLSTLVEVVETGTSGLTAQESTDLANTAAAAAAAEAAALAAEATSDLSRKYQGNRAVISPDDLTVTIYDDDDTTPILVLDVSADKRERVPQ